MPLQLSGRIISGIRNSRKIPFASTHLFHLLAPHHREWPCPDLHGSDLIAYVLALDCSAQQCTNGAWCPRRTAAAEQTADHILASCPLYHPSNESLGLAAFDNETVDQATVLSIWWNKIGPNEEVTNLLSHIIA